MAFSRSVLRPFIGGSLIVAVGLLSWGAARGHANAQDPASGRDIWRGMFTEAQADRGKVVFQAHCASCHDPNEQGEGPALAADTFLRNWEGHSVGRLYTKILEEMPPTDTQSASPAEKLEVLAFILRENGFPAGSTPLAADREELAQLQIVPKGGAGPLRTGAMVQVVGCLTTTAASTRSWMLTRSTEPAATTLDPQTPATQEATRALGSHTVRLVSVAPSPEAHRGHRVEVKGLLVRNGDDISINVVALRPVASTCP